MKRGHDKKGISPVIATVLLIAMVVIIGIIIFLWIRGIVQDKGSKFGESIQTVCGEVQFQASFNSVSDTLSISNIGNVPVFNFKLKVFDSSTRSTVTYDLASIAPPATWPSKGLLQGQAFSESLTIGNPTEITVIPVLLGSTDSGEKTFTCNDNQGNEIIV